MVSLMEVYIKKRILIIYTGGTIGMMKSDHGYTPEKDSFLEQLNNIQELKDEKMPLWDLVSLEPLLDSSSVSVEKSLRMPMKAMMDLLCCMVLIQWHILLPHYLSCWKI